MAFSYVIGNGDLHAKNVSISGARGILQLSTAYDLLSTRPYKDLKLALEFEGRRRRTRDYWLFSFFTVSHTSASPADAEAVAATGADSLVGCAWAETEAAAVSSARW